MLILAVATLNSIVPEASTATLTRTYMLCVRRTAVRLEPSGDSPESVAKAAVFACQREEAALFAARPQDVNELRETALFYATGQAVAARLCRKTKDCGVTPLPH